MLIINGRERLLNEGKIINVEGKLEERIRKSLS